MNTLLLIKNETNISDVDIRVVKGAILIGLQTLNNGWLRVDYNGTIGVSFPCIPFIIFRTFSMSL